MSHEDKIREILDNEKNFKVDKRWGFGDVVVMEVIFPNCPPQVQRKILVFKGNAPPVSTDRILPHFGHETSPCARFNPDQDGWSKAVGFATRIAKKNRDHEPGGVEITPERVCKVLEGITLLELKPTKEKFEDLVYRYTHLASKKICEHPDWVDDFLETERAVLEAMEAPGL